MLSCLNIRCLLMRRKRLCFIDIP
ncbi:hypothetical protein Golob_014228 [Gossypium lobatum]|uniref:Uncharacterized protein n=1 Tax=Gossypium lobatum TaxID=34289 RepID=A0A7J8LS29_9ROSI|nr:hypothetical protein [Gossypium lobatum]